jgi:hypothetical protein
VRFVGGRVMYWLPTIVLVLAVVADIVAAVE